MGRRCSKRHPAQSRTILRHGTDDSGQGFSPQTLSVLDTVFGDNASSQTLGKDSLGLLARKNPDAGHHAISLDDLLARASFRMREADMGYQHAPSGKRGGEERRGEEGSEDEV